MSPVDSSVYVCECFLYGLIIHPAPSSLKVILVLNLTCQTMINNCNTHNLPLSLRITELEIRVGYSFGCPGFNYFPTFKSFQTRYFYI